MVDQTDNGLWAWKQRENNNRMIALQQASELPSGDVRLTYFGGSAFRITTPSGLTLLIDPWRNPPGGKTKWFLCDFPNLEVDIGLSTHAHFDHDNLHVLRASSLLDRPIGKMTFADITITGIADKHVSESSHCDVDWVKRTEERSDMITKPPHNWRSFDNTIIVIETGDLRILHWGDNRPDVSDDIWDRIGTVDVALLPIDGSQHVLSYDHVASIRKRIAAKIVIPHHYYTPAINDIASTLKSPEAWVDAQEQSTWTETADLTLSKDWVRAQENLSLCFGSHVGFDPTA